MSRRPRLLVSGYYGFGNAGDEAILAGLLEGFRQLMPEAELVVLSGDPEATRSEHGVQAVPRGLSSLRTQLRQADLFLSGGGGLLQDATSWRSPLYYLATLRLARSAGVRTACLGHGIGPLRRRWVRALVRRELSRVHLLAVRDRASLEFLRRLGLPRPVEVTADLAFGLNPPSTQETARVWQKAGLEKEARPAAALCLRLPPGTGNAGLAALLGRALALPCQRLDLRPVFVPMQQDRDAQFAQQVAHAISQPAEIVRANLTAAEMLALIAGFDLVVAMRLHALIFAAICGVPPVAISYDPKIEAMMQEFGLPVATSLSSFDGRALADLVGEVLQKRQALAGVVAQRLPTLRAAALRNIELAASLIR